MVSHPVTWWLMTTAATDPRASTNARPILGRAASTEKKRR